MKLINSKNKKGSLLLGVVFFSAISISLVTAFIGWSVSLSRVSNTVLDKEQAFQIADAGIDYYRWHLAHDPDDFQDGTGTSGPYVHVFYNRNDIAIGEFSLDITAPSEGSNLVTITSTGSIYDNPDATRSIQAKLAIPSFAQWAVVSNDNLKFDEGTEVYGPIHSNQGVRMDGIAYNIVTSSVSDYDDPDHDGDNEFAVHTHVKPPPETGTYDDALGSVAAETPPATMADRTDVFSAGREFPTTTADFVGMSGDFSEMKTASQTNGSYLSSSGAYGYRIQLKTDGTYDLYRVAKLVQQSGSCIDPGNQDGWDLWSIKTTGGETFIDNYDVPADGIIFVEDDVWVSGQVDRYRVTIVAATFPDVPSDRKNIIINNDLTYTNYDGQDAIGLIAQDNINIGLRSADHLRIDGALIAQNGRIGRYYYSDQCTSYYARDELTLFGAIATYGAHEFYYDDGSGYAAISINYDSNLLYGPPPYFPLADEAYSTVSWKEVAN
ncbi:hypothetical protein KC842_00270 [Candidatus Nomurabacteria bacterium]|nr:hypothetical protein [Candidatus Nomurabacteria bacterium]USN94740.1 MAG: hypothetical protein H6791_03230 [Candidatus Nomurabacteria bacterium]